MTIYFCFDYSSEHMRVPIDEPLNLSEAEAILEKENVYAIENDTPMDFSYSLLNDDKVPVTEFKGNFPTTDFSLLKSIVQQLSDFSAEENEALIPWLEQGFNKTIRKRIEPVKSDEFVEEKQPKKKSRLSQIASGVFSKKKTQKTESLPNQLKKSEEIPKNIQEELTEDISFENQVLKQFEIALEMENYKEVIHLFEGHKAALGGRSELLAVAYSYLRMTDIEMAKTVNQQLISAELTEDILRMDQLILLCRAYEEELEKLKSDPVKNSEKIENTIDLITQYRRQMEEI